MATNNSLLERLAKGVVIPAHPLALTADRKLDERSRKRLPRILVSGAAMGAILLAGNWALTGNYAEGQGFLAAAWGLGLLVAGGGVSYFVIAHFTGAMRLGEMKSMLKR